MKPLLVAVFLFFAAPGAAFAGVSLTMREVPLHGERTLAAATPALAVGQAIGRIGCFLVGARRESRWQERRRPFVRQRDAFDYQLLPGDGLNAHSLSLESFIPQRWNQARVDHGRFAGTGLAVKGDAAINSNEPHQFPHLVGAGGEDRLVNETKWLDSAIRRRWQR
jgi:hypothetical protein